MVRKPFRYSANAKGIDLLLIGKERSAEKKIEGYLRDYRLEGSRLRIRQGLSTRQQLDFPQIRASIPEGVFKVAHAERP